MNLGQVEKNTLTEWIPWKDLSYSRKIGRIMPKVKEALVQNCSEGGRVWGNQLWFKGRIFLMTEI